MFPIGDENRQGRVTPIVTWVLVGLNVLVFIYEVMLGSGVDAFIMNWGAIPARVMHGENMPTLLSSMFIHGGFMHLIGNMAFLLIFGDNVEDALGHLRYFIFYMITGFAAHAAHIVLNPDSMIPTVGASGAISGVLGAYIVMFRSNRVRVFLFYSVIAVPAWMMIGFWALQQFLSTWGSVARPDVSDGVAYAAHVGGFIAGVILALVLGRTRRDIEPVYARGRERYR